MGFVDIVIGVLAVPIVLGAFAVLVPLIRRSERSLNNPTSSPTVPLPGYAGAVLNAKACP
jgi:hypothetical protein